MCKSATSCCRDISSGVPQVFQRFQCYLSNMKKLYELGGGTFFRRPRIIGWFMDWLPHLTTESRVTCRCTYNFYANSLGRHLSVWFRHRHISMLLTIGGFSSFNAFPLLVIIRGIKFTIWHRPPNTCVLGVWPLSAVSPLSYPIPARLR